MTYEEIRAGARDAEMRYERSRLLKAMRACSWSPKSSSEMLNITQSTFYRALGRHPDLRTMLDQRGPGRGRPRGS